MLYYEEKDSVRVPSIQMDIGNDIVAFSRLVQSQPFLFYFSLEGLIFMATVLRSELSPKNKYYIDKHRYYELKHFCLQYPEWKRSYTDLEDIDIPLAMMENMPTSNLPGDPTYKRALLRTFYSERIKLIEKVAMETDPYLYAYIIKGVTEGRSYTYLKTVLGIPCGKDMYYNRYRKFFWLLSETRD